LRIFLESTPEQERAKYLFRLFDLDKDEAVGRDDLHKMLRYLDNYDICNGDDGNGHPRSVQQQEQEGQMVGRGGVNEFYVIERMRH